MKVLNDNGECTTAINPSYVNPNRFLYYVRNPMSIYEENDVLKHRCSYSADPYRCQFCPFVCKYRKNWGDSND